MTDRFDERIAMIDAHLDSYGRPRTRCRMPCEACSGTGDATSAEHFTTTEPNRAALGLEPLAVQSKGSARKCAGCGVPADARTAGCVQCRERHAKRRARQSRSAG